MIIPPINQFAQLGRFPSSSTLLTGSLPKYAYRFNPITLDESRYSIESGVINLNKTGL